MKPGHATSGFIRRQIILARSATENVALPQMLKSSLWTPLAEHQGHGVGHVAGVGERADLLAVAENLERRLPTHGLVDEVGNDVGHAEGDFAGALDVRKLAAADGVERPHDDVVEPELLRRAADDVFAEQFLHPVVRQRHRLRQGVLLGHRPLHALVDHRGRKVVERRLRRGGQRAVDGVREDLRVVAGDLVRNPVEVLDAADQRRQAHHRRRNPRSRAARAACVSFRTSRKFGCL